MTIMCVVCMNALSQSLLVCLDMQDPSTGLPACGATCKFHLPAWQSKRCLIVDRMSLSVGYMESVCEAQSTYQEMVYAHIQKNRMLQDCMQRMQVFAT